MRIRHNSNDATNVFPYEVRRKTTPPGTTVVSASGSDTSLISNAKARYMEDVVTPRFSKRRAQGEIMMNSMLSISSERKGEDRPYNGLTYNTYSYDPGLSLLIQDTMYGSGSPAAFGLPQPLLADLKYSDPTAFGIALGQYDYASVGAVESSLLAQCLSKASSGSGTMLLVTAAELPKTLDMVWSITKSLSSLVSTLKKFELEHEGQVLSAFARLSIKEIKLLAKYANTKGGRLNKLKNLRLSPLGMRRLASLCGLWLGYRYGIMATYYDVMSWSRDLKSGKYRARYVSTTATNYGSRVETPVTSNSHQNTLTVSEYSRKTVSSAGCLVAPEFEGLVDSHGAARVLSTAWELIPLSFVLDWLYDVSTRIAAFETSFLCSVKGTWIVHRSELEWFRSFEQTGKTTVSGVYPPLMTVYQGVGSFGNETTMKTTIVERKANPAVSYLPETAVRLNWKRLADGIALTVVLRETFANLLRRL